MIDREKFLELIGRMESKFCWGAKEGIGTYLTMEVGNPHLKIREPINTSTSARLRSRAVKPVGDLSIWIQECDWTFWDGNEVVLTSRDNKSLYKEFKTVDGSIFEGVFINESQITIKTDRCKIVLELDGDSEKTAVSFFVFELGVYSLDGVGNLKYE